MMATSLVEFEPIRELADMRARVDQLFHSTAWPQTMPINLIRQNGQLTLSCDVPGMSADDIEIETEGNRLTIKGERKEEKQEEGSNYLYRECSTGAFLRTISLPPGVDKKNIKAHIEDGVLRLDMKLPEDETKKEKITIEKG